MWQPAMIVIANYMRIFNPQTILSSLVAALFFVPVSADATTIICWDGAYVIDVSHCPPEPPLCPDGSYVADLSFCPKTISCYFLPMEHKVTISGLHDNFLYGMFQGDNLMTAIAYTLENESGIQTTVYINHGNDDEGFGIEISRSLLSGEQTSQEHMAKVGSDGLYEFRKLDGTRLPFEECVVNAIAQEARANPGSNIEFVSSCKNSD